MLIFCLYFFIFCLNIYSVWSVVIQKKLPLLVYLLPVKSVFRLNPFLPRLKWWSSFCLGSEYALRWIEETFFGSKLSLEKIGVRLGLVLVIIHEYQLTYYTKVNNEIKELWWVKRVRRCGVLVKPQDHRSGGSEFEYRWVHSTVLWSLTML